MMNLNENEISISIVVVTYNSSKEVESLIHSILSAVRDVRYEIIIVDNNSQDDTVSKIEAFSNQVKLIANPINVGFASANNQGFNIAMGNFVLILNPDILISENTRLKELCNILIANPKIGIIAPRLNYPDGTIQESVRGYPDLKVQLIRMLKLDRLFKTTRAYKNYILVDLDRSTQSYVDWVIGAFMLLRKDVLLEAGSFDNRYFMYMEDADLCMNLKRNGYKICYAPQFSAVHSYKRESAQFFISKLKWAHIKSSIRFYFKHGI